MSRAKFIDYYLDKCLNEDFELYQIRKELEAKNAPEEEIKTIMRIVDNELQRQVLVKGSNQQSNELVWVGAFLTVIGAGITIGTYTGIINMGSSFLIVYGPFFGGLAILFAGLARKR